MEPITLFLLKADQLGLFDKPTLISGSVRKDGTVVKPHMARRKKRVGMVIPNRAARHIEAADGQGELFGAAPKERLGQTGDLFQGAKAPVAAPESINSKEIDSKLIDAPVPEVAHPSEPQGQTSAVSRVTGLDYAGPLAGIALPAFGVPPGVKKAERKRINQAARDILAGKDAGYSDAERAILAQYSGNGGVGDSLNEFYTRPDVAAAAWKILRNYGVESGEVLEPSSGPGVFLATAPQGVKVVAVELDGVSSRIAGALHASHEVHHASLENFATQDLRRFAGVVGNAPFGVRGALVKDDKPDLPTAEQYFLDTAIDKTVPGGVVALVVPTGIMDGANTRGFRDRLLRKAEFLGAHRMPNTAFEHAHTEVTTDLVLFRRRPDEVAGALSVVGEWGMEHLGLQDHEFVNGRWFDEHPERIYGSLEQGWRAKAGMGRDITVSGGMAGVAEAMSQDVPTGEPKPQPTMQDILALAGDDEILRRKILRASLKRAYEHAKPGDTKVVDGITYVLAGEPPRWHRADHDGEVPPAVEAAEDLVGQLEDLFQDGGAGVDPEHRAEIAAALSDWVKEHGIPSRNKDIRAAAAQDRRYWRLIGAVNNDGSFSGLVTGQGAATEQTFDGIAGRLSRDLGGFTADEIAAEWGRDRDEAMDHLFASPLYAVEADGRTWVTMDDYLAGDLWPRYDAARAALDHEGLAETYRTRYETQIQALERAIAPASLDDVFFELNSAWLPTEILEAWGNDRIRRWQAANPNSGWVPEPFSATFDKGVYTVSGGLFDSKILDKYLNRSGARKDDMGTVSDLNQDFRDWLLASEQRAAMENLYNRKFRGFLSKEYSDAPIEVPGLSAERPLNDYHWPSLKWAMDMGKGIIAADVGLGKTPRALALAKLLKTSGQAKKPLIVVPKSVLANWMDEINAFFPGSKVLAIGENLETGKEDNEAERNRKFHELSQNNDYDFVLISQPAFNDLDLDPITKGEFMENDFWTQRGDSMEQAGDKRRNEIRERYQQALAGRDFRKRSDAIWFNELGVDAMILDEFHAYKNLYAAKARFGDTPKFLGGQGLSNRALDMNYKARWLMDQHGGRGVFGLTATPTKNSPLEIYSMLSHVCPEEFEQRGIRNAEEFLDRYARFEKDMVLGTNGKIEEATVTAGFQNMNELRELMFKYIDRQTAEQVGLKLPARHDEQHLVDMTPAQSLVYGELRALMEQDGKDDEGNNAHIFSIMDKMQKAALDLELLDQKHAGAASPKMEAAAKNIAAKAGEGGQVVFIEALPTHEKMAQMLVKAGLKREEIAIVNAQAASSATARQKIAQAFNAGKIKVVIGNKTMEEGMNLQKSTTDIHHLDLPWEPASMQQRNGRGLRQGNLKERIRIHTYLARGSFDGYRLQTIMAKKDWQDLLWHGDDRVDNLSREGQVSRQDLLVMMAADPDEAAAAMKANKALQEELVGAAGRQSAGEVFIKFQDMKRTFHALKDKDSATARRLQERIDKMRAQLRHDKHFEAKDALDGEGEVLVQPKTGMVFQKGQGFEIAGGSGAPVNASDGPTRWVVEGIDSRAGALHVRRYGSDQSTLLDIAHLAEAKRFDYHPDAENAERVRKSVADGLTSGIKAAFGKAPVPDGLPERLAHAFQEFESKHGADWHITHRHELPDALRHALRDEDLPEGVADGLVQGVSDLAVFARHGVNLPGLANVSQLRDLPPAIWEREGDTLQRVLKKRLASYGFGPSSNAQMAMINRATGAPEVFESYNVRKQAESHDIPMPTPALREQMLQRWVDQHLGRKIETNYVQRGRKSGYGGEAHGIKATYGGIIQYDNPWSGAGQDLFGEGFVSEADSRMRAKVHEYIQSGGDFNTAFGFATGAANLQANTAKFPADTIKELWSSAARHGALDKPIGEVVRFDRYGHGEGKVNEGFLYQQKSGRHEQMAPTTQVADVLVTLASSAGHHELASAMKVKAAAISGKPADQVLRELVAMAPTRNDPDLNPMAHTFSGKTFTHREYPRHILEAIQHVLGAGGVAQPVRTLDQHGTLSNRRGHHLDAIFRNQDRDLGEVVAELLNQAA